MKFTKDKLEKAFAELTEQEGFPQHMYISISHKREEVLIEEDLQTFLLSQYAGQGITINETQSIILQLKFLSASNLHENNKTFLKMMGGTTVKENYLNSVVTDYIRQVEKKSKQNLIHENKWEEAFCKIERITKKFPLPLLRIESFNGFTPKIDTYHLNLYKELGTKEACISFCGDFFSFTCGNSIRIYKQWEIHKEKELTGKTEDDNKPIAWFPHYPFKNDGSNIKTNGSSQHEFIEAENTVYQYVIIAIGIMLEKLFEGDFFMIFHDQPTDKVGEIQNWLEQLFNEDFDLPLYFNKPKILQSLNPFYENKTHLATRFEHLYRKRYKQNMVFAMENIGYEPSLECYAEILADNSFGTFGYFDVLNAWIAATQDLEKTLELISTSKNLRNKNLQKNPEDIDLSIILKELLNQYILWTPQQRELLEYHFNTNKNALETGESSIWDSIFRITGNVVEICPMFATPDELFEAFMFHEPKNGKSFKKIIDEWIMKNKNQYLEIKNKIETFANDKNPIPENDSREIEDLKIKFYEENFPNSKNFEKPFIELAINLNPVILSLEESIKTFMKLINNTLNGEESKNKFDSLKSMNLEEKRSQIKYFLKKNRFALTTHSDFLNWLESEKDNNVLNSILLVVSNSIPNKKFAYVIFRILWDKNYWDFWRQENINNASQKQLN
ncbi:hypothetical protein CHS0354_000610 [Potamilus streckersoni]|uniref:Uncharacterized protein n=1 Tax=Potamilus streckersoni TaxID=2493646 RepID=A0AAE0T797_9BIVA|nr:hypothetical protein CHS0354_000610 [Potamilus streckersoni]